MSRSEGWWREWWVRRMRNDDEENVEGKDVKDKGNKTHHIIRT